MVLAPPNKNIIGSSWISKIRKLSNGNVDKKKSRVMDQGYT